jgi:hypothetical protein
LTEVKYATDDVVELELSPKLKQSGIVTSFALRRKINSIVVSLNHEYDNKTIVFSIDASKWSNTIENFQRRLKKKQIRSEHITQLEDVLDNNFDTILQLSGNGQ